MNLRKVARKVSLPFLAIGVVFGIFVVMTSVAATLSTPPPFVTLGDGHVGKYFWSVWAERPGDREGAGRHGAQRPFLSVEVGEPSIGNTFKSSEVGLGTGIPGHLTARREPLIVTNHAFAKGKVVMTVIGMAFAPAASFIELTRPNGRLEKIHLHVLNRQQARKTRLERFHYAAFAVRGSWCFDEMTSYNAQGAKLWDSGEGRCPTEHESRPTLLRRDPLTLPSAGRLSGNRGTRRKRQSMARL